jgi:osmoprotectant transport system permease protein
MSYPKRLVLLLAGIGLTAVLLLLFRPTCGIRVAFDAEFHTRPDGYEGLCRHYGFEFPEEPRQMDPGLMYRVLADGAADVIDAFATDGRIEAYDLLVLEDDQGYFPPYYAAPLVRKSTLTKHPELGRALNRLAGRIPDETMRPLNYEVDGEGRKASHVAREFLVSEGLLAGDARPSDGLAGSITIGGKQFTEQEILGEIVATLIECRTQLNVVRRLNLGGTMICFRALQAGDLDLYIEYTGTGLVNILQREVISDPEESYNLVKRVFGEEHDLIWLSPFGFNNTYTLTMRRRQAQDLGIKTISDLAGHLRAR